MKNTTKTVGAVAGAVGTAGAVAACAGCCVSLPLVAPLLAWFSLSGVGFAAIGWSLPVAGAAIVVLAVFLFLVRRRRPGPTCQRTAIACECASACSMQSAAGRRSAHD